MAFCFLSVAAKRFLPEISEGSNVEAAIPIVLFLKLSLEDKKVVSGLDLRLIRSI